jgi:hypothetical protein
MVQAASDLEMRACPLWVDAVDKVDGSTGLFAARLG